MSERGNISPWRMCRGFTLVEALVGLLFAAIVIPTAVAALLTANRAGLASARMHSAVQLADRKLTESVLTDGWQDGETEGDFGDEYPGFRWELTNENWGQDTMRRVIVTVTFKVQGREQRCTLSTLVEESTE
ncbi:MAG: type II secretion system protein [Candidatus Hydrogenedentes bacterium]|nr:type II secretion system protein [Candidatus Hydrogenedentota bacterium]